MKKKELVAALAVRTGESQAACERILDALPEVAIPSLAKGLSIPLPGLGKLKIKQLAARSLRSFGQQVDVPERQAVRFSAGKDLKAALATDEAAV